MKSGCSYRIHMGCGEPLRSRWWVAKAQRASSAGQEEMSVERLSRQDISVRAGGKCKI
jgi:hypothetical protein